MYGNYCYGEPRYEGAYDQGCKQGGSSSFVLLVVLFILLIIVGSTFC